MHGYIPRLLEDGIKKDLDFFPVVAILGPRQSGKSTLAKHIIQKKERSVYLDLEDYNDLDRLHDPLFYFTRYAGSLICLDEIQLRPNIFPAIKSFVDKDNKNTRFLLLGSASPELLKQSAETLAGRISYKYLSPFSILELSRTKNFDILNLWLQGGFPGSFLNPENSYIWRDNFIKTYIERDIPQLGINIPSMNLRRFLLMCAHSAGQIFNASKLGESLGISHTTIKKYLTLLEQTFLVRTLTPYFKNLKKRIVKSPKIYIRDTGILHSLLKIETFDELMSHPVYGSSWESFCIEQILSTFQKAESYFYRTSNGAELDIIIEKAKIRVGIEFKVSSRVKPTRGFWNSLEDLNIEEAWIIYPKPGKYEIQENIWVSGIIEFLDTWADRLAL